MSTRPALLPSLLAATLVVLAAAPHAEGRKFSSLKKYDDVEMEQVSESFEDFEEPKLKPFWSVEGGAKAKLVAAFGTDGKQALDVMFPDRTSVLRYRRGGLDGFGGSYSRSLEVLGARFIFNDRFVFDAFNPSAKNVRLVVTFASRGFPFTLKPGANTVSISTEDVASAVYRMTQATQSIGFSVEDPPKATVVFDRMRLEREGTGPNMKRFAKCVDFGPDDMLHPGFLPVDSRTAYDARRGCGWLRPNLLDEKNKLQTVRSSGAEPLDDFLRDGVMNLSSPFLVDLPPGKYRVHVVGGSNWGGIYNLTPVDYDFSIKAEGVVQHLAVRASDQEERVQMFYGHDQTQYEFDEDLWAKFAHETFDPVVFDVDVADGQLDLEFLTSPQPDKGVLNFLIVYPVEQAAAVEPEIRRMWYGIIRRYNRVSFRMLDPALAAELKKPDLHEEFLDPKRRAEKVAAVASRPESAGRDVLLFARDHFDQVYPDTVPGAKDETDVFAAQGAPGELVSVAVNLFALRELKGLRLEVDPLEGPRGRSIPASDLDVRFLRYSRRMLAPRATGDWQYMVVPWYLVKADGVDVDRHMSVRFWTSVALPRDAFPGRYTGAVRVTTSKGVQAQARLEVDVLPFRLRKAEAQLGVIYCVQPFDAGNEPYGQSTRMQNASGLPRSHAKNVETLFAKLHREEIGASLAALRGCGFDTLYGGDWLKDVETANRQTPEPMRFIDVNAANRAAVRRTSAEKRRDPFVYVDAPGRSAYLFALESYDEQVIRALQAEKLRVYLGYPNTSLPVIDDVGVARLLPGLFLWRSGADGVIVGPARSSWGDPYNPLDGYGGERGSLLLPSSRDWPAPNTSRILEEMREGITDYRYLVTLEKAVELAGARPEAKAAAEFLAGLRKDLSGVLSDYVEPTGGAGWRTRSDAGWTAERFNRLRRDATGHILAIRTALGLPEGPEATAQDWP